MAARTFVVLLALLVAGAPTVVVGQASLAAKARAIGESFPFSPNTSVRVLAIGERSATALRGRERRSPVLLDLEFDAGSEVEGVMLTPRRAFVLRVEEQRFRVVGSAREWEPNA